MAESAALSIQAPASDLLTLENTALCVRMMPRMGGKLVSIVARSWDGEHELLHPPIHPYNTATSTSSFELSDAGGWDECLPSVGACTYGGAEIPDHGDVWRRPWETVVKHDAVLAHVSAYSAPLRFSRWMSLDGATMHLRYAVTNTGVHGVDFLWCAHPLFQVQEGDRIVLPETVHEVRVEGSSLAELPADLVSWPHAQLNNGQRIDLSMVGPRDGATSCKLFAGPLDAGWCGLYRASLKLGIVLRFDPGQTPYAGLWISHGAWPENGGMQTQYTVALEPTTAPCDALDEAARRGQAQHLLPQAEFSWPLQLEVFGTQHPISYDEFHSLASTPLKH